MRPRKGAALRHGYGRVVLVSGGSRGIGAATVRRLAAAGWDISFCHHHDAPSAFEAEEVEQAASELGARVLAVQADTTRATEVTSWVRRAEEVLGPVQAVVSCAGIARDRPLMLLEDADWRAVIDTNLDGVFHLCRAVLPAMMGRQAGRIVTVSSVSGVYGDAAERVPRAEHGVHQGAAHAGPLPVGPDGQRAEGQHRRVADVSPRAQHVPGHVAAGSGGHQRQGREPGPARAEFIDQPDLRRSMARRARPRERGGRDRADHLGVGLPLPSDQHRYTMAPAGSRRN